MQLLKLILLVLFFVTATSAAEANLEDGRAWYAGLSQLEREQIQRDLILLGFYRGLVDGIYGAGTFDAIASYQEAQSDWPTGLLEASELTRMRSSANQRALSLGLGPVADPRAHMEITIPEAELPVVEPTETGTLYSSNDGSIALETIAAPYGEYSFRDLFVLTRETFGSSITYESFKADRFAIAGSVDDVSAYCTFLPGRTASIGFCAYWSNEREAEGSLIATYVASNFSIRETETLPEVPERERIALEPQIPDTEAPNASADPRPVPEDDLREVGIFAFFPAEPEVMYLVGEIGHLSNLDFAKALSEHPETTLLVLSSIGGNVKTGLDIAEAVYSRGIATYVPEGSVCHSACSFVLLAGSHRAVEGTLGVHQISGGELEEGQIILSYVLEALRRYSVHHEVITLMLQTPPDQIYELSAAELRRFGINTVSIVGNQ